MLELKFTAKFKKDYKRAKKQGKDLEKLEKILEKLVCREELPKFHYVRHMMMLSQCTLRRQPW